MPLRLITGYRLRRAMLGAVVLGALTACVDKAPAPEQKPERVATEVVSFEPTAADLSLTGSVAARVESQLSFQINGRVVERFVDVSDRVRAGDLLARLDPAQQQADVEAAQASVASAEATFDQARTTFQRQQQLLESGSTTRSSFENAREDLRNAEGSLNSARASLGNAREQLTFTELRADADGIITERRTETGQVAAAAQPVFTLAHDGEREAVFDVYEALLLDEPSPSTELTVRLVSDPAVEAKARVREISPTFDDRTGTVRVRLTLLNPPPQMGLGAAVVGVGQGRRQDLAMLSWRALTADAKGPAVWVVDETTRAVSLRSIEVDSYRTGYILVKAGLKPGERVVTAGSQLLREGQVVDVAQDASA
ncbi:efflux RND transporter periplasmic adaptor subunit [Aureimonas phyllosphaerae]|uniref:RND family efflux transporter MFP subunit n=1 Tax=Aureimonas phyllosphaerae TaxID=1166078 RepID=A0A7W6C214_9HYPH|nr:efflux RND transporter periplasmic adaptor subunit [Aureimonas phyllosphaerae]MBB3937032.1 RND family efflux transporter MFP subunit [Aureimonas phyllosphaerae]MBB3960853.1 RND family efflux transporter MFP subunit [Aureimonas phyllosphaerae]